MKTACLNDDCRYILFRWRKRNWAIRRSDELTQRILIVKRITGKGESFRAENCRRVGGLGLETELVMCVFVCVCVSESVCRQLDRQTYARTHTGIRIVLVLINMK